MKKLLVVLGVMMTVQAYGYDMMDFSSPMSNPVAMMNPINPHPVAVAMNPMNVWHDTYYGTSKKHSTKGLLQICLDYKGGKGCYKRDCELYKGKKYCAYKECIKYGGGKACNDRIKSR